MELSRCGIYLCMIIIKWMTKSFGMLFKMTFLFFDNKLWNIFRLLIGMNGKVRLL